MNIEPLSPLNQDRKEELSLKDLLGVLRDTIAYLSSKWILVVLFSIIGSVLGFTYAFYRKPTYIATTTFVLEEGDSNSGSLGSIGGLASMVGIGFGGGGGLFSGDNILELYKSSTMIRKALLSKALFDQHPKLLIDRYIEFNDLRNKWTRTDWSHANFTDTAKFTILQDSIMREVIKEINNYNLVVTKPDKKLSVISVNFSSKDEKFAKVFCDQIVTCVNDFYISTKTKRAVENVNILQQKTDSVRAVMNGAIYTAARVSDATPNLNPTRQVQRVAPVQRSQFTAETNKQILSELTKNLELSNISLRKETPLIQIIDKPFFPLENDRKGKVITALIGGFIAFIITVFLLIGLRIRSQFNLEWKS